MPTTFMAGCGALCVMRGRCIMRWALCWLACVMLPSRIGSTHQSWMTGCRWRAHPRVCGEHITRADKPEAVVGSSPRLRGALVDNDGDAHWNRLIPASAGSTRAPKSPVPCARAHPRVCGEHSPSMPTPTCGRGSSPRLRGALLHRQPLRLPHRLIPASAGSTRRDRRTCHIMQAHPRVCGEHICG